MLLQAEPGITVAGEAGAGSEAITAARNLDPDIVLMDVRMPGMDGIEAAAHLVRAGRRAKILMLTTVDLDEDVYRVCQPILRQRRKPGPDPAQPVSSITGHPRIIAGPGPAATTTPLARPPRRTDPADKARPDLVRPAFS